MSAINKVGRRKTAIARVYIQPGNGSITINKKDIKDYFLASTLHYQVNLPFELTNTLGQFDVKVTVRGGGSSGQAEAVRLGISRALCEVDAENRPLLKKDGLLTRDSRMVERKKPGQKKARKKFQFSKR
jgi:small subunit ribosomal protein S9|eukprot:GDKH01007633.1.p1 GENE.GDKH01007633.1~~GDKH01007633.1.p1  ORF type:complete len:129 (-),score=13.75 GDKH01007633.1:73-459(-)